MEKFKSRIASLLAEKVNLSKAEIYHDIEIPPDPGLGDFAFPCFKLAKELRQNPAAIAGDLVEQIGEDQFFSHIQAQGPYINFTCNLQTLNEITLGEVLDKKDKYGEKEEGRGKTVIIDFSSPNIAKPFGFGHLRSTVIGNTLANIYEALGYQVVRINHLGDWGTQFGNLIAAYLRWGEPEKVDQDPIDYLYELYVKFHEKAEVQPELKEEGRQWFKRLEEGDETATNLWKWFKELSLREFERVYDKLGVKFDSYRGEAFYNDRLEMTVEKIKSAGIASYSEGALVVDLSEFDLPLCLIKKKDGATLYITRDISAAIFRQENYQFHKALYVVGADQELHFQQMFSVLDKMGYSWAEKMEHVAFGLVRFQHGKMSTRKGNLVFLEDVLDKAEELAYDIIEEKNPTLENKSEVAEMVGVGAIIFGDLSNDRVKDINFDWEKILDFNGETAPYLQYTHARICSILRKSNQKPVFKPELMGHLTSSYERNVVLKLAGFSDSISRAKQQNKPHILARYLLELARDFNKFYNQCPILSEEKNLQTARLLLIESVRQVLKNGLGMMGISAPHAM